MIYVVRYYDANGKVVKEPFHSPLAATERWYALVAAGHKSVKLKTENSER